MFQEGLTAGKWPTIYMSDLKWHIYYLTVLPIFAKNNMDSIISLISDYNIGLVVLIVRS